MKSDNIILVASASIQTFCGITQTNELFQLIQIIIGCISGALAVAYYIWKWYKNAKKDGKITKDEIEDLFENMPIKKEDSEDEHRN